jgi:hypothetical protein
VAVAQAMFRSADDIQVVLITVARRPCLGVGVPTRRGRRGDHEHPAGYGHHLSP